MCVASGPSNDRGRQQRLRLRAYSRPSHEHIPLVAMTHQQMHNQITCQWYAGTVSGIPYDEGLEERDRLYWYYLVRACSWTAPTVSWCACRWGLVHVEVALQDPFLKMIRLSGRLWHLLDWLLGS